MKLGSVDIICSSRGRLLTPEQMKSSLALADFARRLERERDFYRKALEKYRGQINQYGEESASVDLDSLFQD